MIVSRSSARPRRSCRRRASLEFRAAAGTLPGCRAPAAPPPRGCLRSVGPSRRQLLRRPCLRAVRFRQGAPRPILRQGWNTTAPARPGSAIRGRARSQGFSWVNRKLPKTETVPLRWAAGCRHPSLRVRRYSRHLLGHTERSGEREPRSCSHHLDRRLHDLGRVRIGPTRTRAVNGPRDDCSPSSNGAPALAIGIM